MEQYLKFRQAYIYLINNPAATSDLLEIIVGRASARQIQVDGH